MVMWPTMKRNVIPQNVGNYAVFTTRLGIMFITALLDVTVLANKFHSMDFWVIKQSSHVVDEYHSFRDTYCLHLKG
jgi:hypothetical protein